MYINALTKYRLHKATCFGRETAIIRPMQNIHKVQHKCALYGITYHDMYLVYVLHGPDDGCFTAETCSLDVTDFSSMR